MKYELYEFKPNDIVGIGDRCWIIYHPESTSYEMVFALGSISHASFFDVPRIPRKTVDKHEFICAANTLEELQEKGIAEYPELLV